MPDAFQINITSPHRWKRGAFARAAARVAGDFVGSGQTAARGFLGAPAVLVVPPCGCEGAR